MRTIAILVGLLIGTGFLAPLASASVDEAIPDGSTCDETEGLVPYLKCYLIDNGPVAYIVREVNWQLNFTLNTTGWADEQGRALVAAGEDAAGRQVIITQEAKEGVEDARDEYLIWVNGALAGSVQFLVDTADGECWFYLGQPCPNGWFSSNSVGEAISHCDIEDGVVFYLVCVATELASAFVTHYTQVANGTADFALETAGDGVHATTIFAGAAANETFDTALATADNVETFREDVEAVGAEAKDYAKFAAHEECVRVFGPNDPICDFRILKSEE